MLSAYQGKKVGSVWYNWLAGKVKTKYTIIIRVHHLNGSFSYWFPPQRDKARTNKHGIEVIIKNHDSPIDQHDEIHTPSGCM